MFVYGTNCTGSERRLADCSSISNPVTSCDYTQNVAVTCNGKMIGNTISPNVYFRQNKLLLLINKLGIYIHKIFLCTIYVNRHHDRNKWYLTP